MSTTISALTAANSIDAALDYLPIVTASLNTTQKINRNTFLNIASQPVGLSDSQTLTNKTITGPTISGPVLSGTITGTYTIGGTPTFPSSVVTLTGTQALTNKTLTSPTITSPTITNAAISADTITGFTVSTTGTFYGISIAAGVLTTSQSVQGGALVNSTVGNSQLASGIPVQVVNTINSAVATGSTTIPFDDTIPQNTEGDQYMSLAITPKSSSNTLVIQVNAMLANATTSKMMIGALFQDSTANALSTASFYLAAAGAPTMLTLTHTMSAGTTSSTTFKFRAGEETGGGTTTFNGAAGARKYGGVASISSIVIWEYKS